MFISSTHEERVRAAFLASAADPEGAAQVLSAAINSWSGVIDSGGLTQLGNRQTPMTVAELAAELKVDKVEARAYEESPALTAVLQAQASEDQYLEVYPPRAKADLPIRRGRIADVAAAFRSAGRVDDWRTVCLEAWQYRWDVIFTTLVLAMAFLVDDWWHTAHELPVALAS